MSLQNVIVCDDIREEVGGKKSLMGVLAGDLVLAEMPGIVQLSIYGEYHKDPGQGAKLQLRLSQDDMEIASAAISVPPDGNRIAILVLPKALIQFEKECEFIVRVSINDGAETEIVRKKVTMAANVSSASPLPS